MMDSSAVIWLVIIGVALIYVIITVVKERMEENAKKNGDLDWLYEYCDTFEYERAKRMGMRERNECCGRCEHSFEEFPAMRCTNAPLEKFDTITGRHETFDKCIEVWGTKECEFKPKEGEKDDGSR